MEYTYTAVVKVVEYDAESDKYFTYYPIYSHVRNLGEAMTELKKDFNEDSIISVTISLTDAISSVSRHDAIKLLKGVETCGIDNGNDYEIENEF